MDIFYFPRGRDSIPPKFHLIPPKNFFFPTWKIKILHLDISKYPRGNPFCKQDCPNFAEGSLTLFRRYEKRSRELTGSRDLVVILHREATRPPLCKARRGLLLAEEYLEALSS